MIPQQSTEPLKWALGDLVSLLSLVIAGSLAASLAYDWGFLTSLGLSFAEVPSSIADHTRGALVWMPAFVAGQFAFLALELITRRVEGGKSEEEIINESGNPARWRAIRRSPIWGFAALPVLFFLGYVLVGSLGTVLLAMAASMTWLWIASWIFSHPRVAEPVPQGVRWMFIWGPAIALWLYGAGWMDGVARGYGAPRSIMETVGEQSSEVSVLRMYEGGLLYMSDDKIRFRRWDSIRALDIDGRPPPRPGLMCVFVRCPRMAPGSRSQD